MSSILKALKKVENVPPPEEGENALRNRISKPGPAVSPRRDPRPALLTGGIIVILLAVLLASRFFSPPLQPALKGAADPVPAPARETAAVEPSTPAAPPAATAEPAPEAKTAPSPREAVKVEEKAGPSVESVQKAAVPQTVPKPAPIPIDDTRKVVSPPKKKPVKPFVRRPNLRLEGIIWSDSPKSRFAVINGKIVRQGGTVEGVRVTRIAVDHVRVQSRDGAWKTRLFVE